MVRMLSILGLIALGLLAASCFATGVLFSMEPLIITGIVATVVFIVILALIMYFFPKPSTTQVQTNPTQRYTANNMNSMKRNKSDTDLELISRQGEAQDLA